MIGLLLALICLGAWMGGVQVWAYYHFRAGRAAVAQYHSDKAVEHLQSCLRIWPRDPDVLLLAARAARRVEEFDQAEQFLDRCDALPNRPSEELAVERLCLIADRGDIDEVLPICMAKVEADDSAAPLILEAMTTGFIRLFRVRAAHGALDRWLARDPDNTRALFLKAVLNELLEDRESALEGFLRVLELDPEYDEARLRAVMHLVDNSAASDALPHLDYLRRRQPNNPFIPLLQARCRDQLGDQEAAVKILDELIARQPYFAQALGDRGKLARRAGDNDEAERLLRQAAALDPGDRTIIFQLGQCLAQNGKIKEAKIVDAHRTQMEEDIKNLRTLMSYRLEQRPRDAELQYEAGSIAMRSGSFKDAVRWFESALKIDPKHAPSHRMLAGYYQQIGQFGQAARHLELARQADKEKGVDASKKAPKP